MIAFFFFFLSRVNRADIAVDRDRAQQLKADNVKAAEKGMDKRNLYLANEGLVVDDSTNGTSSFPEMIEEDRKKRQNAQSEKRKKLINPLFYVSANRSVCLTLIMKYLVSRYCFLTPTHFMYFS